MVILINNRLENEISKDFIGIGDLPWRKEPSMRTCVFDVMSIDYNENKLDILSKIKKFHIAKLDPGQCLYVPEGWAHIVAVYEGGEHTIEIRWERKDHEHDLQCKGESFLTKSSFNLIKSRSTISGKAISPRATLHEAAWPGEFVQKPPERSADRTRNDGDRSMNLFNRLIYKEKDVELNFDQFLEKVRFIYWLTMNR